MNPQCKQKNKLKCTICRAEISLSNKIYQSQETFGIVCHNCIKKFPYQDLELIMHLFLLYGGYFAQKRRTDISILDIIKDSLNEINSFKEEEIDIFNINQLLLHKALLHGYTPQEYMLKLQELLDVPDANFYS